MQFYLNKVGPLSFLMIVSLSWLCNLLVNVYLSNHLSPEAYGDLFIALNLLSLFGTFISAGTLSMIPVTVPKLKRSTPMHHLQFSLWILKTVAAVYGLSLLSLTLIFLLFSFKWITLHNQGWHLAYYTFFIAPCYSLSNIISSYLNITGKGALSQITSSVSGSFCMLAAFAAFHLLKVPEPIEIIILKAAIGIGFDTHAHIHHFERGDNPLALRHHK